MANDSDWVADVRRWYFSSRQEPAASAAQALEPDELGYEAAHPGLQSRHWPDVPRGDQLVERN